MTRAIALLGAGSLLALTACGDKDTGETGETGEDTAEDTGETGVECTDYDGAPYIGLSGDYCDSPDPAPDDAVLFGCDTTDGVWFYDIYTVGVTSGGDLDITQTGSANPWNESHPLTSFDFGTSWDNLYLELTDVDDINAVVDGSTTLYDCGDTDREASLTWAVTLYDVDGSDAGCWAWGHDPASTGCDEYTWE